MSSVLFRRDLLNYPLMLTWPKHQPDKAAMGRSGYNGGEPTATTPKKDGTYYSSYWQGQVVIPRNPHIIDSGEGLQNEHGGFQAEFGYLISRGISPREPTEKPRRFRFKRRKSVTNTRLVKNPLGRIWVTASVLIKQAPDAVRDYHSRYPSRPKPYGLSPADPHNFEEYTKGK